MREQLEQVYEFNTLAGRDMSLTPRRVDPSAFKAQFLLIAEEVEEIVQAFQKGDYIGVLDGMIDTQYVLNGLVELFGFRHEFIEGFQHVHNNNMTKVKDADGKVIAQFNNEGKIIKPEGYHSIKLETYFPHIAELSHVA